MRDLHCAHVLTGTDGSVASGRTIRIDGERIVSVDAAPSGKAEPVLALPAPANAHDHARPMRTSSIGTAGMPLELWLNYLALIPAVDPYLACAVSLGRTALGGSGTVMVHYTRVQGLTDLPTEVTQVARAAGDVGVRVGFAMAMRDRNPLVYGPSESILAALSPAAREEVSRRLIRAPLPVAEQLALVDAVAAAAGGPMFDVQYGPQGVQWCSHDLLVAIADASRRTGRRIHMHLLETRYQRAWADREYPDGVVKFLDSIGLLSPRLTLAHCVWARPEELDLLATRGVTISTNPSSNLTLHSGIAPVRDMLSRGCRVALGLDAGTMDEDDDALRELRLANLLHHGTGFRVDADREALLTMVLRNGRRSVINKDDGGAIAAGQPADILVLDWDALDYERLLPDLNPCDLLFARACAEHVRELIVAGKPVVRDGKVLGIDLPGLTNELMNRFRSGLAGNAAFSAALADLGPVLAKHYEHEAPCC
jgi:cytosine/adenosine deaminase-related metal-dependent hydrolase